MKKTPERLFALLAAAGLLTLGTGGAVAGGLVDTSPDAFGAATFDANSADITNPWWTLTGNDNDNYLYYAHGKDECEWNLVEVMGSYLHDFHTPYTKDNGPEDPGINARIFLDRAWVDENCIDDPDVDDFYEFMASEPDATESTYDWYAQDAEENIWYLGEDTYDGEDKHGSFVAGCDGAEAGIVMQGEPHNGDFYAQEFYEDEAEDWGKVLNFMLADDEVCMTTKEWTPLERGHIEHKTYCSDGDYGELALVHELKGKTVLVELIDKNVDAPAFDSDWISPEPECPIYPGPAVP